MKGPGGGQHLQPRFTLGVSPFPAFSTSFCEVAQDCLSTVRNTGAAVRNHKSYERVQRGGGEPS